MRNHIVYLLGLFLTLGMLPSCEEPENIGGSLRPDDFSISTHYVDTFEMKVSTVQLDSVRTINLRRLLFGHYEHPYFGVSEAIAYTQVLPSSAIDSLRLVPDDVVATPVYDSVSMGLQFNYRYGPDAAPGTSRIQIYELAAGMDTTGGKGYYIEDTLPLGQLLADSAVAFEEETAFARLRLPQEFGKNLFDKIAQGTLKDRNTVAAELDGIAIKTDGQSNAMYAIDPASTNSALRVHYHYITTDDDTVSTSIALFTGVRFHHINTDRTGTPLEVLSDDNELPSEVLGNQGALQAGTGTMIRLDFPSEMQEFGVARKRVIDRAELWFTPVPGTVAENEQPPETLYFLKADASGNNGIYNEDGSLQYAITETSAEATADYIANGQNYGILNLTRYVADLVDGLEPNNGLIVYPRDQASSTINPLLIGDAKHPGKYPFKLRIYYTEFE